MLAPRTESLSRRSSNLQDSRTSLDGSYRSASSRRTSGSSDHFGSRLSLRRSQMPPNQLQQHKHMRNAEEQGSVSEQPPSLDDSETSVLTELSSSRSSSRSSLQAPSPRLPSKYDTLQRFYATRGAPSENHATIQRATLQRSNNLHSATNFERSRGNFFLSSTRGEKESSWGQFVDTEEAEEDLTRRSRILSIRRRYAVIPPRG